MKFRYDVLLAIALFACAFPLRAQTGCVDSPEDPTVVLALVGSAGVLLSIVRGRLKGRCKSSER
jgi:XrtJ-associated TM-motif-TM protein